jgi:hypothetical protein
VKEAPVTTADPARTCQAPGCGKPLERRRYPGGTLEERASFARRRYCGHRCAALAQQAARRAAHPQLRPAGTLAPRDPATPSGERDGNDPDEFRKALEKATTASLRREPGRQPWGASSQRRSRQAAG